MTSNEKQPPMEDDLKIQKLKYLSNYQQFLVISYSYLKLKLCEGEKRKKEIITLLIVATTN